MIWILIGNFSDVEMYDLVMTTKEWKRRTISDSLSECTFFNSYIFFHLVNYVKGIFIFSWFSLKNNYLIYHGVVVSVRIIRDSISKFLSSLSSYNNKKKQQQQQKQKKTTKNKLHAYIENLVLKWDKNIL
jgi:hypothetical protein